MAGVSQTRFPADLGMTIVKDDDADHTLTDNIDNGPTTMQHVYVVNDGYATKIYLKIWDDTDPVAGTDAPDYQFPVPASDDRSFFFRNAKLKNGLSFGASTDAGTPCTSAPTTPPDIYVVTNGGN